MQVMHPANNMDALLKNEINPAKMKKIAGGMCDAVCLPSEMGGGTCPCNSNLAYTITSTKSK